MFVPIPPVEPGFRPVTAYEAEFGCEVAIDASHRSEHPYLTGLTRTGDID